MYKLSGMCNYINEMVDKFHSFLNKLAWLCFAMLYKNNTFKSFSVKFQLF